MALSGEDIDQTKLDGLIKEAVAEVNEQRLSDIHQIEFLVRLIIPAVKEGKITVDTTAQIEKLCEISEDMERRVDDPQFENVVELSVLSKLQAPSERNCLSPTQWTSKCLRRVLRQYWHLIRI